ncbi:Gfo/Idh/MocA family protein [Nitrospinota bacterium]
MTSEKGRLAFVGLGNFSRVLADAAGRADNCEIVNCFARTESTRKEFAEKHGCRHGESLDEVLSDPEVEGVVVVTPHSTHADIICRAASAGKHIFIEKPLTLTVAEAKRATEAVAQAGVILQVGHHRRLQGATRRIREMIDAGELGEIYQLEANLSMPGGVRPGWRDDPAECPVGAMTGLGVHMVDNLHYLAGPAKRLFAFSSKLSSEGNLDDVTSIVLEFESGPLGYIGTTRGIPKVFNTAAFGTGGNAWSEEEGNRLFVQKQGESARTEIPIEASDGYVDELTEFARCIRSGEKPRAGGPEATEVVAVLEAVIESVNTGQAVDVGKFRA